MRLSIKLPFILLALFSLSVVSFGSSASDVNRPAGGNFVIDDEDETPEVTDRVARISSVAGDAKIRRGGAEEWETVTLNLPIVEGDEIITETYSRLEIQFDKNTHLRLDKNSILKLATLKDHGIAASLSTGRASLLTNNFDKERSFFEIDGPKVTIAVQKAGRYMFEAGKQGGGEVQLTVDNGGEARVYSENAGFTLKDQRTARVFIDGPNEGEWETSASFSSNDNFALWIFDREESVARGLKDAHYGKYYDQDLYGAEDLNDNGDWVDTDDYGYVWQPSRLATAQYSNWSPYRYGHWRWMPPYGWTWVNDEPWGWATYHHGRWFNYRGRWVWSPYGYYRSRRSWWSPALVVINIYNNNVCWFLLSYHRRRNNFNWNYQRRRNSTNPGTIARDPRNPPLTGAVQTGKIRNGKYPIDVPPTGIITTDSKDFGKRNMRVMTAPEPIAKTVFLNPEGDLSPMLPDYKDKKRTTDVITERPKIDPAVQTRVGAAPRKAKAPLDGELQKTRMFGGRPPKTTETETREPVRGTQPRNTGAIERTPVLRQPVDPVRATPPGSEPTKVRQPAPIYTAPETVERTRTPRPQSQPQPRQTERKDPPQRIERTQPPVKQAPKNDPPPAKAPSKDVSRPAPSQKEKPITR